LISELSFHECDKVETHNARIASSYTADVVNLFYRINRKRADISTKPDRYSDHEEIFAKTHKGVLQDTRKFQNQRKTSRYKQMNRQCVNSLSHT